MEMPLYKKFMKHAKKISKDLTKGERPALEGVLHQVGGSLCATDAHMLYYGKELHDLDIDADRVITPTGRKLDLEYPNVTRLIPDFTPNFNVRIEVDVFLKALEFIRVPGKVDRIVTDMQFVENTVKHEQRDGEFQVKHVVPISMPEGESFYSNAEYWINALKMFKDFNYTEVKFNFYSRLRPFTLISPDDKITALITPMRRH